LSSSTTSWSFRWQSLKNNPAITRLLVEQGADIQFIGEVRQSLEQIYLEMLHGENEARQA